jgi:hypothetical protein
MLFPGHEAFSVHQTVQKHRCNEARKRKALTKVTAFQLPCGILARQRRLHQRKPQDALEALAV